MKNNLNLTAQTSQKGTLNITFIFQVCCASKCIFSTHTRDGTWRDGTKNGQIGCLAGVRFKYTFFNKPVCASILRICPSLDNASPSAKHTIFKQSVVSDQTHSPQWPLDDKKRICGQTLLDEQLSEARGKQWVQD